MTEKFKTILLTAITSIFGTIAIGYGVQKFVNYKWPSKTIRQADAFKKHFGNRLKTKEDVDRAIAHLKTKKENAEKTIKNEETEKPLTVAEARVFLSNYPTFLLTLQVYRDTMF